MEAKQPAATRPVMRSAVHRQHQGLGVRWLREGDWELPAAYGPVDQELRSLRDGLAVADVSGLAKVDLRGDLGALPAVRAHGSVPKGQLLSLSAGEGDRLAVIGGGWAIALAPPARRVSLTEELVESGVSALLSTEASSMYAGFAVGGPAAGRLLNRLGAFDAASLEPARCAATRLARIPAVLVRRRLEVPLLECFVGSEFGRYLWEAIAGAGRDLGLRPVGWEALRQAGWS